MQKQQLIAAFAGFGEWVGLTAPERASLWVERFGMNEQEIERFRNAPTPATSAYVATPVTPDPPLHSVDPGAQPYVPRLSAQESITKARARTDLNAFSRLPPTLDKPPSGGYLRGVPFAVKDFIGVQGLPRSGGSRTEPESPFPQDAAAVASMRRQGAVFIGLTNLHELAFGASSNNPLFGPVVNPAAPQRIPGGSSGGSAAAVAAAIVDIALATDTGGSIRIPAACCGVVGFKPSYDAIPRVGAIDMAESLDHIGPIGRSVEDCARAFAAMTDLPTYPGLRQIGLEGVRVGVLGGFFEQPLDAEVRAALRSAQAVLVDNGAALHGCEIPGIELASAIQFMTISSEAATAQNERLRDHGHDLGEDVRVRLEMASLIPAQWYLKAQRLRSELVANISSLFDHADVLLSATMRSPAPFIDTPTVLIEGEQYPLHTAVSNLTLPYSLSGMPAIAIPWGRAKDGAPLSIQLAAPRGKDWLLLEIAHQIAALEPS